MCLLLCYVTLGLMQHGWSIVLLNLCVAINIITSVESLLMLIIIYYLLKCIIDIYL